MKIIDIRDIITVGNGRADYTDAMESTVKKVIRSHQTYISTGYEYLMPSYTSYIVYYAPGYLTQGDYAYYEMHASALAPYAAPVPLSGWMIRVGIGYYDTKTATNTEKIRGYGYGEVNMIFPCGVWFAALTPTQYPSLTLYNNNPYYQYFELSLRGLLDYAP